MINMLLLILSRYSAALEEVKYDGLAKRNVELFPLIGLISALELHPPSDALVMRTLLGSSPGGSITVSSKDDGGAAVHTRKQRQHAGSIRPDIG